MYRLILVGICIAIFRGTVWLLTGCGQGCPCSASVMKKRVWGREEGIPFLSYGLLSDGRLKRLLGDREAISVSGNGGYVVATLDAVHDRDVEVFYLLAHRKGKLYGRDFLGKMLRPPT